MNLSKNVTKQNNGKYGSILPYCLTMKRGLAFSHKPCFRISERDYMYLCDEPIGSHKCFAFLEKYEIWCRVKIFKFWVVSYEAVKDDQTKKYIEEEILS